MLILKDNFIAGSDGDTALFTDITGTTAPNSYGKSGNITYADVDAVRLKIATLTSITDVSTLTLGDIIIPYVEYICTDGSGTIDNKLVSVGNTYVFNTTGLSVTGTIELQTTGNYVPLILATWLPTASQAALTISLDQINQGSNTTMDDSVYTIDYEVYKDSFTGTTAAVDGQHYMVLTFIATYDGNTYRAGDTFIASDTTDIVAIGNVVILDSVATTYFVVTYNMTSEIFQVLPNSTEQAQKEIYEIRIQLEALSYSCQTNNVSFVYADGLLRKLQSQVTYLLNNLV